MANYTIELRTILKSRDIFKSISYDLYNNEYKQIFEDKFKKRFYFREIGQETIERFLIGLETTLCEIMPYYEHLYKTTNYKYEPILNYDLTEEITRQILSENVSSLQGSTNVNTNNFDTPITKNDTYKKYPNMIIEGSDITSSRTTGNNKANETNKRRTYGNIGVQSAQDMIEKERKIIINIDSQLLDELEILFMQIF